MKFLVRETTDEDAITMDDGQNVHDRIKPELMAGREVELDFDGVSVFASPFFNAAIGQLLKDIDSETLNRLLRIENLNPLGHDVLGAWSITPRGTTIPRNTATCKPASCSAWPGRMGSVDQLPG